MSVSFRRGRVTPAPLTNRLTARFASSSAPMTFPWMVSPLVGCKTLTHTSRGAVWRSTHGPSIIAISGCCSIMQSTITSRPITLTADTGYRHKPLRTAPSHWRTSAGSQSCRLNPALRGGATSFCCPSALRVSISKTSHF